jgi:DNA-binding response OmpR family regulator
MAKVLVIDDEPNARVLLDIHLRHREYDVVLAGDGWQGLQLYHQEHLDVILLDLKMPRLDEVTLLKKVRDVVLKQPVIVLTGNSDPETEQQFPAIGVDEYIVKSPSMRLLDSTLTRLLTGGAPNFG